MKPCTTSLCRWYGYVIRFRVPKSGPLYYHGHYTGISTNPQARFAKHKNGKGAKALRGTRIEALVWLSKHPVTRAEAQRGEAAVKRLSPADKADAHRVESAWAGGISFGE